MKKKSGSKAGSKKGAMPACRMAYSLNNGQPVKCSYISDQPLFYMDFEGDLTEDAAGGEFGADVIEAGIEAMQRQLSAMDALADRFLQEDSLAYQTFVADAAQALAPAAPAAPFASIEFLTAMLRKSRLGAAYLNFAAQHKTALHYTREVATAFYDRRNGQIYINPDLPDAERILLAARELRRAWQHRSGALVHPLTFHPDQAILVNRAQIADLAGAMVRIAWELQLADEKTAWERLENSSMADLTYAFAREAYLDFRTLNNGTAGSAVFEAWFLSERCRIEDRRLIQQMLADYQGYVFDSDAASRTVSADLIVALGSMPFGKNYLSPFVQTIVGDPVFTEIRDRSNANFLWFIKFERSFREAEQELQSHEGTARGDRHGAFNDKKRLGDNGPEKIITLPRHGQGALPAPQLPGAKHKKQRGADIIDFTALVRRKR